MIAEKNGGIPIAAAMALAAFALLPSCGEKSYVDNATLVNQAIEAAATKGEWDKAKNLTGKAVSQNPNDPNARTLLALALEQEGALKNAIAEAEGAVDADGDNFMAQYTLGRLRFKAKDYGNCPAPLKKAKLLKSKDPRVTLLLARTYAMLDIDKEAIKNYAELAATDRYAQRPEPYNELGVLFFKRRDYPRAKKYFRTALEKDPNNSVVNQNMAVFWDRIAAICAKSDARKARIAKTKAIGHYKACLDALSPSNPANAERRRLIEKRIEALAK